MCKQTTEETVSVRDALVSSIKSLTAEEREAIYEKISEAIDLAAKLVYKKTRQAWQSADLYTRCPKCDAEIKLDKKTLKIFKKSWGFVCPECGRVSKKRPVLNSLYFKTDTED